MIRHRTEIQDPPVANRQAGYVRAVVSDSVFDPNRLIALVALTFPTMRIRRREMRRGGAAQA
jgi:hypothetical protein